MRAHNLQITGSLNISGSKGINFSNATGGVSGSFRPSDIKTALPANTVSSSAQIAADISGSFSTAHLSSKIADVVSSSAQLASDISGSFSKAHLSSKIANIVSSSAQIADEISGSFTQASSSLETNKASKGFAIAMSVAL